MPFVKLRQVPDGYLVFSFHLSGIFLAPYFAPNTAPAIAPMVSASLPKFPANINPDLKDLPLLQYSSLCLKFHKTNYPEEQS